MTMHQLFSNDDKKTKEVDVSFMLERLRAFINKPVELTLIVNYKTTETNIGVPNSYLYAKAICEKLLGRELKKDENPFVTLYEKGIDIDSLNLFIMETNALLDRVVRAVFGDDLQEVKFVKWTTVTKEELKCLMTSMPV